MNKRRAYACMIIALAAVILIVGAVLLWCVPEEPVKDAEKIEIIGIYRIEDGKYTDISNEVDGDLLKMLLPMLRAQRVATVNAPTSTSDHMFEIDCVYDNKSLHIIFGKPEVSCVYSSSNGGMHRIENPESWVSLMQELCDIEG